MKIVFCIPSLGAGGAERVVSVLSNKLVERGHEVSVLMISHRLCVYPLSEAVGIECIECDKDNALPYIKRYPRRLGKIRRAIKRLSPDVVISFMSETNTDVCFALAGMNIPVIVSERNDPAVDPASRIKQIMRKIAYAKPRGFVFQTPDAQAYFSKKIQKRSRIILNPLSAALPEPFEGEREKRIVAVGRLNKQKNFPMLIDAFAKFSAAHPEYVLEIYGEGTLEGKLREYITEKGLEGKARLEGFCSNVHERILSASLFVMSSDFEGMPNALLEAMAIGMPCISTDCPCGGPRMLIEHGANGFLVKVGDSEGLLEAMEYMVNNPDRAEKMSQSAYGIRRRTDVDEITDQWSEMIDLSRER